jgi:hypothetical protein
VDIKINDFLQNSHIQKFINQAKELQNKQTPALLLSFNVSKKIDMFKVYFEIDRIYSEEVITQFLPTSEDFLKFVKYWNRSRESSLCFGKKITDTGDVVDYFHIKFDPAKKVYREFPEFLAPKFTDRSYDLNSETGVSYEYINGKKIQKNYFYYTMPLDKIFIAKKFNLSFDNPSHYEYTEFENDCKVISVYDQNFSTNDAVIRFLDKANNPIINHLVDYFNTNYELLPQFYGVYKNFAKTAIYWSLTNRKELWNMFNDR